MFFFFRVNKRISALCIFFIVLFSARFSSAQNKTQLDSLNSVVRKQENSNRIDTSGVLALIKLGQYNFNKNVNHTLKLATRAADWSRKLNYPKGECMSLTLKGNIYIQQGDYVKAQPNYEKALKIALDNHLTPNLAKVYLDLGAMYMSIGDFYKSLSYELKAEKYDQELNEGIELAKVLGDIGLLEYYMHNRNKAIKYLKESSKDAGNNESIQAQLDNNLGVIYLEKADDQKALTYQLKAKKLREQLHDSVGLAYSYFNIGNIYMNQNKLKTALHYHRKSIVIRKKLSLKKDLAYSYYEIGEIYLKERDYAQAERYFNLSLKIAHSIHNRINEQRSLKLLSDIYARKNNYKKAYDFRKQYEVVSDSLLNQQKEKKFNNALTEYDINKKSQKIKLLEKEQELQKARLKKDYIFNEALIGGSLGLLLLIFLIWNLYRIKNNSEKKLRQKNIELEKTSKQIQKNEQLLKEHNEKLARLNEEKNEFVHIVAHDLKNPLVGISSVAEIINDVDHYFKRYSRDDIKKHTGLIIRAADELQKLVKSLLDVNRIESGTRSADFSPVNISDILSSVIDSQFKLAANKEIIIEFNISKNIYVLGNDSSFRQIFDNLLSNSIKYSPLDKTIQVNAFIKDSKAIIAFRDQGVGVPEPERGKLFKKFSRISTKPTNNELSTGLGLYITKRLASEMGGNIRYNDKYLNGAEFIVEFPLSSEI